MARPPFAPLLSECPICGRIARIWINSYASTKVKILCGGCGIEVRAADRVTTVQAWETFAKNWSRNV